MKHVKSSIPRNAVEKSVREGKQEGALHEYQVAKCTLNGILVGQRVYNEKGILILETPLKQGRKHGWELTSDDDGILLLVEPYVNGKIHGTARQYGKDGKVIGTYTLVQGTGFDIWRQESQDGTIFISEIHYIQDGVPHGYEWHFASAKQELWHERSWYLGKLHGIERMWNSHGKLRHGYPEFYVLDQEVPRRKYTEFAVTDKNLPAYIEEQNLPDRDFPAEIQKLLSQ